MNFDFNFKLRILKNVGKLLEKKRKKKEKWGLLFKHMSRANILFIHFLFNFLIYISYT